MGFSFGGLLNGAEHFFGINNNPQPRPQPVRTITQNPVNNRPQPVRTVTQQHSQPFFHFSNPLPRVGHDIGNAFDSGVHTVGQDFHSIASSIHPNTHLNGMQKFVKNDVLNPVARGIAEVPASISGKAYHPGTAVERTIFGNSPVKPVQQDVKGVYRAHANSKSSGLRKLGAGALATGDLALHAAQDIPEAGAVLKGGGKVVAPILKGTAKGIEKFNETGAGKTLAGIGEKVPVGLGTKPVSGTKIRSLTKNMKKSDNFSQNLKDTIDSSYKPFSDKAANQATNEFMKQPLKKAQQQVMSTLVHYGKTGQVGHMFTGHFGKQEVSNAQAVMKALDSKGDINGAQAIHDALAAKLTNAGQTSQAASLIYNRSPEGLKNMAYRDLTKSGVTITKDLAKQIDTAKNAIKTAKGDQAVTKAKANFSKLVGSHIPSSNWDKFVSLYKTGILSSPKTAVKVAVVNPITTALETAKDFPAAAVDKATSLVTGKRTMVAPNARNLGAGLKTGGTQGLKDAKTRLVENIAMPGTSGLADDLRGSNFKAGGPNFGLTKNGARSKLDRLTGGKSSKILNGYTSSIGRVHGALQTPFYEGRGATALHQSAEAEAINKGLTGAEKDAFIQKYLSNAPSEGKNAADRASQYATSQQHTAIGQAASGIQHIPGVGQIIAPITRIPGAVATQVINYSPLGLVKAGIESARDAHAGNFDQRAFSEGMGRAITGSVLQGGGAALAAKGKTTGAYPSDKATQDLWRSQGKTENSVRIGNNYYSIGSPGGPGAQSVLTGGQIYNGVKKGGVLGGLEQGISGGAKIVTDQPYLTGISGAMNAINNPAQGKNLYDQVAGSFIPNFIRDTATSGDPLQRQTSVASPVTSMKNAVTNGIPGLRENNQPQVDVMGNVLSRPTSAIQQFLNPFNPSKATDTNITNELSMLRNQQGQNGKPLTIPTQINKKFQYKDTTGKNQTLSDAQRTQFIEKTGQASQAEINQLMGTADFKNATPEQQSKMIDKIVSGQRDVAKVQLPNSGAKLTSEGNAAQSGILPAIGTDGKVTTAGDKMLNKGLDAGSTNLLRKVGSMSATDKANYLKDPKNSYEYKLATFNNDQLNGKYDSATAFKKEEGLYKESITSNYSNQVNELYGMSKTELNRYLGQQKNAGDLENQLISLDNALYDAGVISKLKFGTGTGSSKGSGKSSKTGGFGSSRSVAIQKLSTNTSNSADKTLLDLAKSTEKLSRPKSIKYNAHASKSSFKVAKGVSGRLAKSGGGRAGHIARISRVRTPKFNQTKGLKVGRIPRGSVSTSKKSGTRIKLTA